jgi:hypothetical protein
MNDEERCEKRPSTSSIEIYEKGQLKTEYQFQEILCLG